MAKLLIVDDEVSEVRALANLLRTEGHDARIVTTPGDALTEMQHDSFDMILLDLTMPYLDGLDFLDAIEDDSRFFDVPVAIYSARCDEATISKAMKLGACEYIIKGMDWEQTYQRIRTHLPQKDADAEIQAAPAAAMDDGNAALA